MYHWGGKEQWCKGSSPFALLLLPLRVRPHLTLLMLGHFKCLSLQNYLLSVLKNNSLLFFFVNFILTSMNHFHLNSEKQVAFIQSDTYTVKTSLFFISIYQKQEFIGVYLKY